MTARLEAAIWRQFTGGIQFLNFRSAGFYTLMAFVFAFTQNYRGDLT